MPDSWTKAQLSRAFREAGLSENDVVLVHSSLRALGPVSGGADAVIDALLETVGTRGTVAVPTHTFAVVTPRQPVFHQRHTPANVGTLPNVLRSRPEAERSLHPTHSIAAIGARAEDLVEGHERDTTPCSADGPYRRLVDWGGKVLIIGVGLECCTLFHGCEEWSGMPWAVKRRPIRLYSITADGHEIPVTMHQHSINTWDQYPRLEPDLKEIGALRIGRIGECPLRLLDARRAADWLVARLQRDPSIILPDRVPQ